MRSDNVILGKGGRANTNVEQWARGRVMWENITSGQSGDCLVYLGLLIYMWICAWTMVCVLYITNHRWHHHLSSNKMMCLVRVHGATVGVVRGVWSNLWTWITNRGKPRSKSEVGRAWVKCISPASFMDIHLSHIWLHSMVSILLIGWYLYSHRVIGRAPWGLKSYKIPPFRHCPLWPWEIGRLSLWLSQFITPLFFSLWHTYLTDFNIILKIYYIGITAS